MRAPNHAQRGAALLSFAVFLGLIVLGIITAFSASILRKQQSTLLPRQQAYVETIVQRAGAFYEANAGDIDRDSTWSSYSVNTFKAASVDQEMFGVTLLVSDRLTSPDGLVKYRRVLAYVPTDTDPTNPPDFSAFSYTGNFTTCTDPVRPCDTRAFAIYDGMDLQKRNYSATVKRIQAVALNAQSYFKARVLQDPERNATVNYFLPATGCSNVLTNDLPCLPSEYINLADAGVSQQLGLEPSLFKSGWGDAIQITNVGPAAAATTVPYSMAIRARLPWGGFLQVYATPTL